MTTATRLATRALAPLLVAGLLAQTLVFGQSWQPNLFQFYCGSKGGVNFWVGATTTVMGGRHLNHHQWYLDAMAVGMDLDQPSSDCAMNRPMSELEDMARRALQTFRQVGAPNKQFAMTSAKLSPVVEDANGQQRVRLYADPEFKGIGQTEAHGPRDRPGGVYGFTTARSEFGLTWLDHADDAMAYRNIAHELFHKIQQAQPYYSDGSGIQNWGEIAPWLHEGTAEAISMHAMRQEYPGYNPPLSVRGSRSIYGLRPYDRAFTWVSDASDVDGYGHLLVSHYTASSFWMYLADRFFGGQYDYLVDFLSYTQDEANDGRWGTTCVPDDWLCWLNKLLVDTPEIGERFYLVFPDFIANYAAWGEKKYPHLGARYRSAEDIWLAESFRDEGGCREVELSPAQLVESFTLDLWPISARCVRVTVTGIQPGELFAVKWMMYDQEQKLLDNLHLAASRLGGILAEEGKAFDCYDEAKARGPGALCLTKPYIGDKRARLSLTQERGAAPYPAAVTPSGTELVKTWDGRKQEATTSDPVENLYFLVHTPLHPSDEEHDYRRPGNRTQQTARIQIALEPPTKLSLSTGGSVPKAMSSVDGTADLGMIPMQGSEGNFTDQFANLMSVGSDPDVASRAGFLQNLPFGTTMPALGPCEGGICSVDLQVKEVRPDEFGGRELATTTMIKLSFAENPIPFGGTGTYKAMVSGCQSDDCTGGVMLGEGVAQVIRFDDDVLHLTASGKYCAIRGFSNLCRQEETFEAEVVKPFGWAYDPARTFASLDTPGIAVYRDHISRLVSQTVPGVLPGGTAPGTSPDGPAGAGGGSTVSGAAGDGNANVVSDGCDCTCSGYQSIMETMENYQAEVRRAASAREQPPPPPPAMQSAARCSIQCARQWAVCQGPGN